MVNPMGQRSACTQKATDRTGSGRWRLRPAGAARSSTRPGAEAWIKVPVFWMETDLSCTKSSQSEFPFVYTILLQSSYNTSILEYPPAIINRRSMNTSLVYMDSAKFSSTTLRLACWSSRVGAVFCMRHSWLRGTELPCSGWTNSHSRFSCPIESPPWSRRGRAQLPILQSRCRSPCELQRSGWNLKRCLARRHTRLLPLARDPTSSLPSSPHPAAPSPRWCPWAQGLPQDWEVRVDWGDALAEEPMAEVVGTHLSIPWECPTEAAASHTPTSGILFRTRPVAAPGWPTTIWKNMEIISSHLPSQIFCRKIVQNQQNKSHNLASNLTQQQQKETPDIPSRADGLQWLPPRNLRGGNCLAARSGTMPWGKSEDKQFQPKLR